MAIIPETPLEIAVVLIVAGALALACYVFG